MFPGWLIWRAFSTSRQLEQRLAKGDAGLLNDDRFSIDRVTLGPPGTELIEDVQFIPVQQMPTVVQPTSIVEPPQTPLYGQEMNDMNEHMEIERRFIVDAREEKPWRAAAVHRIEQHYTVGDWLKLAKQWSEGEGVTWWLPVERDHLNDRRMDHASSSEE